MAKDEQATVGPNPTRVESELQRELEAISREAMPERLRELAREFQRLTRTRND